MPTSFLGLTTNTQASGSATTFLTWRLNQNDESNSNAAKIDVFAQNISASVVTLQGAIPYAVNATESATNNYAATVSGFTAYTDNKLINLTLDVTQTGTTTLDINGLGTKTLYKIASNGIAGNLGSGDLVAGRPNFFIYDSVGGYWVWVNGTSADQINIAGNANEIVVLSGSGIASSGISASSLSTNDGYFVVTQLSSNLRNESMISEGSGIGIIQNASASTVIVTNNIVGGTNISLSVNTTSSAVTISSGTAASSIAPSTASYIVLSMDAVLTNEKVLTAGSNISIAQDSSASTVTINNTGAAADGWVPVTSGSWTYASATTITVPSGAAAIYSVGDKWKVTANSVVLQGYIITVADTLLTVAGNALTNHTFSSCYYSKSASPVGFPHTFAYTPTGISDTNVTLSGRFEIHGRRCIVDILIQFTGGITFTTMPSLPVTSSASFLGSASAQTSVVGIGGYRDAGTQHFPNGAFPILTANKSVVIIGYGSNGTSISATTPITWANGDDIILHFDYEI